MFNSEKAIDTRITHLQALANELDEDPRSAGPVDPDVVDTLIEVLEEIRALKFGVGEIRKNEKQVKDSARANNKPAH